MGEKIKRMNKGQEITMIFLDDKGHAFGKANYDRWNKLPWYKHLLGFFFYCYKRKFIDMEGFEIKSTNGVIDGFKKENFRIMVDGKEVEIGTFKDLGDGSYVVRA